MFVDEKINGGYKDKEKIVAGEAYSLWVEMAYMDTTVSI